MSRTDDASRSAHLAADSWRPTPRLIENAGDPRACSSHPDHRRLGAARSAGQIIRDQVRGKLGDALEKRNEEILRALENGSTVDAVPQELMPLYRPSAQPYLMSWLRMRPIDELKALSMPTLIVQGTRDVQVSELDARALQAASPGAGLAIIDDMNHVLKAVADDPAEQMAAYSDPKFPIAGQLVESIVRFLKQARGPA